MDWNPSVFIGYEVRGKLTVCKEDQHSSSLLGIFLSPAHSFATVDQPLWSALAKKGQWRGECQVLTQRMSVDEGEAWLRNRMNTEPCNLDIDHKHGESGQNQQNRFVTSAKDRFSLFSTLPGFAEHLSLKDAERALIRLLQGRDLLLEEVLKVVHLGQAPRTKQAAANDLPVSATPTILPSQSPPSSFAIMNIMNALQTLYLIGCFEWTSPLAFVQHREQSAAACHRCGYGSQSIAQDAQQGFASCRRCGYGSPSHSQDAHEWSASVSLSSILSEWKRRWDDVWAPPTFVQTRCARCGRDDCHYCPHCLQMGMAKACEPFLRWNPNWTERQSLVAEPQQADERQSTDGRQWADDRHFDDSRGASQYAFHQKRTLEYTAQKNNHEEAAAEPLLQWQGTLSPAQRRASERLLSFLESTAEEFLIYAVCGAGKTEILYPSLQQALRRRQKVLLTSPRKDVIVELGTRLKEVFPTVSIVILHADSPQRFDKGDLFISTTHQTLRFSHYFDLVVIDEEDAFPYHHDPMLPFAVHKARKKNGKSIYVTATPSAVLQRRVKSGEVQHVRLSRRYHGHPLAVPKWQRIGDWRKAMLKGEILTPLLEFLLHLQQQQRYGYVFVPHVRDLKNVHRYVQEQMLPYIQERHSDFSDAFCSGFVIESVHAGHPDRAGIVQRFRDQAIRLLITTTILERGVTIPYSDVAVLGSDDDIFDTAALIQMAGRVGRKFDDPVGHVWFWAQTKTRSQMKAIRSIRDWNEEAELN